MSRQNGSLLVVAGVILAVIGYFFFFPHKPGKQAAMPGTTTATQSRVPAKQGAQSGSATTGSQRNGSGAGQGSTH